MKRFLLAVVAVLVMAGGAAAEAEADKYVKSVAAVKDILSRGGNVATALVNQCSTDPLPDVGEAGNVVYLTSFYKTRSERLNEYYPASRIECGGQKTSGMVFVNEQEFHVASGRFVRWAKTTKSNSLKHELSADNMIYRIGDDAGNYIVMMFNEGNPRASRFIDAKLPVSINSNGAAVVGGKGLAVSSNELIDGLNRFYRDHIISDPMTALAVSMLTDPGWRQDLIDKGLKAGR